MVDQNDLRDAIDNSATEVFLVYNDAQIVISQSLEKGPNDEPITVLTPDGENHVWNAEGVLDVTIEGQSIRSLLPDMEW